MILKIASKGRGVVNPTEAQVQDYGLFLINQMLIGSGKTLQDFPPMPMPVMDWMVLANNQLIVEQRDYNQDEEQQAGDLARATLNPEQQVAFNAIIAAAEGGLSRYVYHHLLHRKSLGKK